MFGFVFLTGVKANIGVSLWGKRDCGDSGVLGIGFVLHNLISIKEEHRTQNTVPRMSR